MGECADGLITIILRHSQFYFGAVRNVTCSNIGEVIGRSISVGSDNESFTSQLTFTVSKTLNGTTIKCTTESDANIVSANIAQNQLLLLLTEGNLTIIINNNYFEILLNK